MLAWPRILLLFTLVSACRAECTPDALNRAWGLLSHHDAAGAETIARACGDGGAYAPVLHVLLGDVAYQKTDLDTAEREYRKAADLNPSIGRAWLGLGVIADFRSYHRSAQGYLQKAHDLLPDNPEVLYRWAEALSGAGRIAALEKCLEAAKRLGPDRVERLRADLEVARALGGQKLLRLDSPYAPARIRLERILSGGTVRAYGLMVAINGMKPVRLMLDTGANGIILNAATAARCGVKRLAATKLGGLGDTGALSGYAGLAERVSIGGVRFRDCPVVVSDLQTLGGEEGLIGADVFERFLITLDLPAAVLQLDPLPLSTGADDDGPFDPMLSSELDSFTPLYRMGHLLMIPTQVSDAGLSLFGIDTGVRETLISRKLAARLTSVRKDNQTKLGGLSGRVNEVFSADNLVLEFGGFRAHSMNTVSVDLTRISNEMGMEVGGLLGLPVLKMFRIAIDYRDGLVKFEYVPSAGE